MEEKTMNKIKNEICIMKVIFFFYLFLKDEFYLMFLLYVIYLLLKIVLGGDEDE